jgi:hypothetical protein
LNTYHDPTGFLALLPPLPGHYANVNPEASLIFAIHLIEWFVSDLSVGEPSRDDALLARN